MHNAKVKVTSAVMSDQQTQNLKLNKLYIGSLYRIVVVGIGDRDESKPEGMI